MAAPKVTAFTETAALWAVLNEDFSEARRIVDDMLPGERGEFAAQLNRLLGMLGDYCGACGKRVDSSRELVTQVRELGGPRESVCRACAGLDGPQTGGRPVSDRPMTPPRILVRAADVLDAQGWIQNGDYHARADLPPEQCPVDLTAALALAADLDMHSDAAAIPEPGAHADAVLLLARHVLGAGPQTETAPWALNQLTNWQDEPGRTVEQVTAALRAAAAEPAIGVGYPVPGSAIPDKPGYVVGECGHRVAGQEWRNGFRTCERCPSQQAGGVR
jgi:hypothetical protein